MDPIGTITMYFPHMDSRTKDIIQGIMESAYNFKDFVYRLNKEVCNAETTDLAVFFAVHHAALLFDFDCLDRISKIYGKLPIIRPNLFFGSAMLGKKEDLEKVRESADLVLSSNPPEWLEMEMHLVKLEVENEEYPQRVYDTTTIDAITKLLNDNQELDFFKSRFYSALTVRVTRDPDINQALQYNEMAIANAEFHNDVNRLAHLLRAKAGIIQSSNRKQALESLLRARDLMESMGDVSGVGDVLYQLSKLESIRGEYTLAIEHNLESVRCRENLGMPIGLFCLSLSTLFNLVGQSLDGLEWAKVAEEELRDRTLIQNRAVLNQAWSLILMGKLTEALILIDDTRDSIVKSGLESSLGWLYFVTGVSEIAEGDLSAALVSIEGALDIYERSGGFVSYVICMHHMATIEVLLAEAYDSANGSIEIGPWLALLEERARSEDLPGILGQALLLKARLLDLQSNRKDWLEVAKQLRTLAENPNLAFLQPSVDRLLDR